MSKHPPVLDLLAVSLERLADALADRPDLQAALRAERALLPLDEARASQPMPAAPVRDLLYSALAEGELGYRRFDRLMVRVARARRWVRARARRGPLGRACSS